MLLRVVFGLLLAFLSTALFAEAPIVVSKSADKVAVTIYRDPDRSAENFIEFDPDDEEGQLGGFAMIAETRAVDLPPGEVVLRFEGVAGGIVPQSAILVQGDLKEKNFDRRLLSQRGLIDAFTGQPVIVRGTDDATGKTFEERAVIVSHPDRLILKTSRGYEAMQCSSGLDTILFPGVPKDLTAKPTLSMTTRADSKGGRVTLTLAYLAANFDWQANYVGTLAPGGKSLDLFGWMTIASLDRTAFPGAELSAVAGVAARAKPTDEEIDAEEDERDDDPYSPDNIELSAQCWPFGQTARTQWHPVLFRPGTISSLSAPLAVRMDLDGGEYYGGGGGCGDEDGGCADIVVTASRIATRTDIGDLKLYTVPFAADVNARSMKQVRFLPNRTIKGDVVFRARLQDKYLDSDLKLLFAFENRKSKGLGEPLPAGQVSLFQNTAAGRQLVGETSIKDKAVEEDVELELPDAGDYGVEVDDEDTGKDGENWEDRRITVSNANGYAVTFELEIEQSGDYRYSRFSDGTFDRKGKKVWRVTVPADGKKVLTYRATEFEEEDKPDPYDQ